MKTQISAPAPAPGRAITPPRRPAAPADDSATAPSAEAPEPVRPRHRATGPLTSKERQRLAQVGRMAWKRCGAEAAGIPYDDWRHEQVAEATGGRAAGITGISRGQYRDVQAHFLAIAGEGDKAFRAARRAGQGAADRELALAKLREVCEWGGLAWPDYPEAICRRQFKTGLDDLETGKVWFLFYTCTTRARAKRKKAAESDSQAPDAKSAVLTPETRSNAGNPTGGDGESPLRDR